MTSNNITEQCYLDLSNQFKLLINDKNKELEKVKTEFNDMYKKIIIIFGIITLVNDEINYDNFELEALIYKCLHLIENVIENKKFYKIEDEF